MIVQRGQYLTCERSDNSPLSGPGRNSYAEPYTYICRILLRSHYLASEASDRLTSVRPLEILQIYLQIQSHTYVKPHIYLPLLGSGILGLHM